MAMVTMPAVLTRAIVAAIKLDMRQEFFSNDCFDPRSKYVRRAASSIGPGTWSASDRCDRDFEESMRLAPVSIERNK
jgi:hypothetical protein